MQLLVITLDPKLPKIYVACIGVKLDSFYIIMIGNVGISIMNTVILYDMKYATTCDNFGL